MKIPKPKLNKPDRRDKFLRQKKLVCVKNIKSTKNIKNIKSTKNIKNIKSTKNIETDEFLHKLDIRLNNIETHENRRFLLNGTPHTVLNFAVIIHSSHSIDTMNERMMVIDDMKIIHIPDGELNWMENALQCCALIDYIRKYGLDNITLEDAWIVSDGTFVILITDKCIILQELPPLKVIYNKESGSCCPICLHTIELGDELFDIECGHKFHCLCASRLFQRRVNTCPLCREKMFI